MKQLLRDSLKSTARSYRWLFTLIQNYCYCYNPHFESYWFNTIVYCGLNPLAEGFGQELLPPASYGGWMATHLKVTSHAFSCWGRWMQLSLNAKPAKTVSILLWAAGAAVGPASEVGPYMFIQHGLSFFCLAAEKKSILFVYFVQVKPKAESLANLPWR